MQVDLTTTQKRLGDGYCEQKLVREQIGHPSPRSHEPACVAATQGQP